MLSRKEFFRHLLVQGIRAVRDLSAAGDLRPSGSDRGSGFEVPETELGPALLAIEAECRGLSPEGTDPRELRRAIRRELASRCVPPAPEGREEDRARGGAAGPGR